MSRLEIEPDCGKLFAEAGLASLADFLAKDVGQVLSAEPKRELRRLELAGRVFFLKRMGRQSLANSLAILLRGGRPHGTAYREALHVRQLHRAGFAVMQVAAAGERSHFGLPGESFMITREVAGEELDPLFRRSAPAAQRRIAERFGELLGKLHAAGFYGRVRLKDLIAVGGPSPEEGAFTLIDRETRHPYPRTFSRRKAVSLVAAAGLRHRHMGHELHPWTIRRFLLGYLRGVASAWQPRGTELLHACRLSAAQQRGPRRKAKAPH